MHRFGPSYGALMRSGVVQTAIAPGRLSDDQAYGFARH